jgi:hypothetical protein
MAEREEEGGGGKGNARNIGGHRLPVTGHRAGFDATLHLVLLSAQVSASLPSPSLSSQLATRASQRHACRSSKQKAEYTSAASHTFTQRRLRDPCLLALARLSIIARSSRLHNPHFGRRTCQSPLRHATPAHPLPSAHGISTMKLLADARKLRLRDATLDRRRETWSTRHACGLSTTAGALG